MKIGVGIVEDNEAMSAECVDCLKATRRFRVAGVWQSAEKAKKEILKARPQTVLTYIELPGQRGIDLIRAVKPKLCECQFVMLTGFAETHIVFDALRSGAAGYLLKITPCKKLSRLLLELQRSGSPISAEIARHVVRYFHSVCDTAAVLSPQESRVLDLFSRGLCLKEVSCELGVSFNTANTYARRIYEKLQVTSRGAAVAKYCAMGGPGRDRGSS